MNQQDHVDGATLNMLRDVLEDGFAGLLETFVKDSEQKIRSLKAGLASADAEAVRRSAHSLKGSSSNLGANALARFSREVELRARENQLEGLDRLIGQLEAEYGTVIEILKKASNSGSPV